MRIEFSWRGLCKRSQTAHLTQYPSISSADVRVSLWLVLLEMVTVEDSERSGIALEKCS
jgi:hypothetical protein